MFIFPSTPTAPVAVDPPTPLPPTEYGPGTNGAETIATELEALAMREPSEDRGRQLASLAAAMRDAAAAVLWRDVPLHAAFAGLAVEPEIQPRDRLLQLLHLIRAAVIFLPLLVSWWGIHGAVSAYRERLADDPDQGAQTFFREWLGGFGGELWLSFDRMAAIVVASVLVLILASIAIEWMQRIAAAEADAAETRMRDRIDTALTEAALHLRAMPGSDPDEVERRLNQIVDRSAGLLEALTTAVDAVRGELAALEASSGEFRTVAAGLEGGARSIAEAAEQLDGTISQQHARTAKAFEDAGKAAAAELGAAANGLQTGIADQLDRTAQVLTEVGLAVTEAVGQGERHRDSLGRIMREHREEDARALADAMSQRHTALADELRRAGEDIAAKLAGVVEIEVDQRLRDQLDGIGRTNLQLHSSVDGLTQSVHFLGQALGRTPLPAPLPPQGPRRWFRR
ncbi:hypothetical protein [Glycomyces sp. NPDC021274]|uniref:hypothetical protein n=1 Tax=Glycomyces sp. NPDC021274 TaxID=3155120 RepID=UPI0033CBE200